MSSENAEGPNNEDAELSETENRRCQSFRDVNENGALSRQLRQEVNELREEQRQLKDKIFVIEQTKFQTENSLSSANARMHDLEKEKLDWVKDKESLKAEIRACEKEAEKLRREQEKLEETTLRQKDEIQQNSMLRSTFLQEIQDAQKRADDAQRLLAEEKMSFTEKCQLLQNQKEEAKQRVEVLESTCTEKQRAITALQEESEAKEQENVRIRGQLADDMAKLSKQLYKRNLDLQDAQDKIFLLEQTKSQTANSITASYATIREFEKERLEWEKEKKSLKAEIRACKQEAEKLRMDKEKLEETTLQQKDELQQNGKLSSAFLVEIQDTLKRADEAERLLAIEKKRLTDTTDQLNLKLNEIMKEKKELQDVILEQDGKKTSTEEYLRWLNDKLSTLETGMTLCEMEKRNLQEECHRLQSQLEEERKQKEALTQNLKSLRETCREKQEDYERLQRQLNEVETLKKKVTENLLSLEKTCREKEDTIDQLHNQNRENLEIMKRLKENSSSLLQQKGASELVEKQLRGELSALAEQNRIFEQEIAQKTETCRSLQQKLHDATTQQANFTQKVSRLEQTCAEKQDTIEQLYNQNRENLEKIRRLEVTDSSLTQQMEASEQEKNQLKAENSSIRLELARVRGLNENLQAMLNVLETQKQTAQDNLLAFGQQNITHKMQAIEARTELEQLKRQLDTQNTQTRELSEKVLQLERQVTSLTAEADKHRNNVQRLEDQLRVTRDLVQSRDETIASLREEVSQRESALNGALSHHREQQAVIHAKNEELYRRQREAEENTQRKEQELRSQNTRVKRLGLS